MVDESNSSATPLTAPPGLGQNHQGDRQADTLQTEQARLLYSNLPVSIAVSGMLVILLVYVQASVIPPGRLFGWSAVIGAILVGRAVLYIGWRRACTANQSDTRRWLYLFRVSAIVIGFVWGVGGVLLASSGDLGHKIYVSFVLAGLCAGAATTLAIDRISANGFLVFVLVPQIIFLATEGDTVSLDMSAMLVLFLIFILASTRQSGIKLKENFHLRQKAVEDESRLHQMLESSPIAARIAEDVSDRVVFANSSYISLIDSTPEQIIGVVPNRYYAHPDVYADKMERLRKGERVTNELVELRSPGKPVWTKWVLASYFPVEYQNKPAILGWFYDITDRKLMEDQIKHMAYHDTLTGLPNRSLFLDRLKQAIAGAERENRMLVLMFLDLDNFKPVNDQHGHQIDDLLLKIVAERILSCLRKSDSVARIGGDEFIILLHSMKMEKNALEIAEKIRHSLNQPFEIEGLTLAITSSTGVAIYPDHADNEHDLIKRADIAMYYAKAEGRNCVKVYRQEMKEQNG